MFIVIDETFGYYWQKVWLLTFGYYKKRSLITDKSEQPRIAPIKWMHAMCVELLDPAKKKEKV